MLTTDDQLSAPDGDESDDNGFTSQLLTTDLPKESRQRIYSVEWLGQSIASLCWIGSVLAYGITTSGDWLQLCAAYSWLLANIASAVTAKNH